MKEWKTYFMDLLGVEESRVRMGNTEGRIQDDEGVITREEFKRAIMNLKEKKAGGVDEIPNEVWKYGGMELQEWALRMCNRV